LKEIPTALSLLSAICLCLFFVYTYHIYLNPNIPLSNKYRWPFYFALFGPFAMLAYWDRHIYQNGMLSAAVKS